MELKSIRNRQAEDKLKSGLENTLEIRVILQLLFDYGSADLMRPDTRRIYKSGEIRAKFQQLVSGRLRYKVPEKTVRENLDRLVDAGIARKYFENEIAVAGNKATFYSLSEEGIGLARIIALSALKVFADEEISPSAVQCIAGSNNGNEQKALNKFKILLALYDQSALHTKDRRFRRDYPLMAPLERKIGDIIQITGISYKNVEWHMRKMRADGLIVPTYKYQRFKVVGDTSSYFSGLAEKRNASITRALASAAEKGELAVGGELEEFTAREVCDRCYGGRSYDNIRRALMRMESAGVLQSLNHLTLSTPVTLTPQCERVAAHLFIPLYRLFAGTDREASMEILRAHATFFAENPTQFDKYLVKMMKIYVANSSSPNRKQ